MPFLTSENLPEIAQELFTLVQAQPLRYQREKEPFAFFYGAEDSYLVTSGYTALFANSLLNGNDFTLEQIEQILREQLEKLNVLRGEGKAADLVVALVGKSQWHDAETTDADAQACREKANQVGQKWHKEGLEADEAFEQAQKEVAGSHDFQRLSSEGLVECLECGARYETQGQVDVDGMGCRRCN